MEFFPPLPVFEVRGQKADAAETRPETRRGTLSGGRGGRGGRGGILAGSGRGGGDSGGARGQYRAGDGVARKTSEKSVP
jgi:hypothetical protein